MVRFPLIMLSLDDAGVVQLLRCSLDLFPSSLTRPPSCFFASFFFADRGASLAPLFFGLTRHVYLSASHTPCFVLLIPFELKPPFGTHSGGARVRLRACAYSCTPFFCCRHRVQQQCVETHLHDVPVVAHPGGKLNTNVAWSELGNVLFLVNGSRCAM